MSAICGIFHRTGEPLPPQALDPIMDAMRQYGRDGAHTWQEGPLALGHQMTHVTPESMSERLPYEDSESGMVITADARIDNREELFSLLKIHTGESATIPDSLLILKAYQRWGSDCTRYLLGDYAFAIWNGQDQQLFCARDIIGAKPFYFFHNNYTFCFASDMAALLRSSEVVTDLNLQYVRAFLEEPGFYHKEFTFYQDVFKLPPANSLLVNSRDYHRSVFWSPGETTEVRYQWEEEYIDQLRELMQRSVECRLRSAFHVGSHLSGGLDSSTVSVLASRALPTEVRPLHVFSWAPPPKPEEYPLFDERALIETICQKEGMIAHYTSLLPEYLLDDQAQDITTQPSQTSFHERIVCREAAGLGMRVLLSGWGGDEIPAFNGRGYFADLFRCFRWTTLTREIYLRARLQEWNIWDGIRASILLPLIPDLMLSLLRPNTLKRNSHLPLPRSLQPAFASKLQSISPLKKPYLRERPGVHRNQIDLINNGHLTERMESWAIIGAVNNIEYRYPLTDRRIIEYCLNIPSWLYFKDGWKRYIFRRAVNGILPQDIQWKKKKTDPAWLQGMKTNREKGFSLMVDNLKKRRDAILSAGYVNPDDLLEELYQFQGQKPKDKQPEIKYSSAMWLAFVAVKHQSVSS